MRRNMERNTRKRMFLDGETMLGMLKTVRTGLNLQKGAQTVLKSIGHMEFVVKRKGGPDGLVVV